MNCRLQNLQINCFLTLGPPVVVFCLLAVVLPVEDVELVDLELAVVVDCGDKGA